MLARRAQAVGCSLEGLREESDRWRFLRALQVARLVGDTSDAIMNTLAQNVRRGGYRGAQVIRALRDIRSPAAVQVLEVGLGHEDWWIVLESAEAMGRIRPRDPGVRAALQKVADSHWSPGVRAFAAEVVAALDVPSAPDPTLQRPGFDYGFAHCVPEETEERWRFSYRGQLERRILTAWPAPAVPEGFPTVCMTAAFSSRGWELPANMTAVHAVTGGWLAVMNRGELGGMVAFVGKDGSGYPILGALPFNGFVEDADGRGLWGIYGLCHGVGTTGSVQRLERRSDSWQITDTSTLPASARGAWHDDDGTLLIATEAGVVKMNADGSFELLGCR